MSEKFTDPHVMEQNIRNVMDYWTTITREDLTNFFNALRADAWDEGKEDAMRGLDIHGDTDAENPYREANDDR